MKRLDCALGLVAALLPGLAWPACGGIDLMARLRAEDPVQAAVIEARAASAPNSEGLFWRIEKAGTAPSHLFGTYHASAAVEHVPEAAWRALDRARIAVFEVTQEEEAAMQARMQSDPAFILDPAAPKFAELMSAEDLAHVRQLYRARGMAIEAVERMRPWMQIALVAFPPCQLKASLAGEQGIDHLMAARARAAGLRDAGLESYEDGIAGLSALERDTVVKLLIATGRYAEMEEDLFRTNILFYAAGRTSMIFEFSMWMSERSLPDDDLKDVGDWMTGRMIDGRNAKWMANLVPHLEAGNAFVAVGALHLPGANGLVELLRRAGYTVTRAD